MNNWNYLEPQVTRWIQQQTGLPKNKKFIRKSGYLGSSRFSTQVSWAYLKQVKSQDLAGLDGFTEDFPEILGR